MGGTEVQFPLCSYPTASEAMKNRWIHPLERRRGGATMTVSPRRMGEVISIKCKFTIHSRSRCRHATEAEASVNEWCRLPSVKEPQYSQAPSVQVSFPGVQEVILCSVCDSNSVQRHGTAVSNSNGFPGPPSVQLRGSDTQTKPSHVTQRSRWNILTP